MKTEDLLAQALDIRAPWQIDRVRNDFGKDQCDIWITRQSGRGSWFFGNRNAPAHGYEQSWRHLNIGQMRCVVHAVRPSDGSESPSWIGHDDQPFSQALSRKIAGMLRDGVSLQAICNLLDVTVADLWKFKHSLDNGKSGLSVAASPTEGPQGAVPAAGNPVWENLLDGSLNIDIRVLSLKLLLTKLREQFAVISDAEVRVMKCHEMQRYFMRHEKLLAHELAQLSGALNPTTGH
jgi:hypothetical protein